MPFRLTQPETFLASMESRGPIATMEASACYVDCSFFALLLEFSILHCTVLRTYYTLSVVAYVPYSRDGLLKAINLFAKGQRHLHGMSVPTHGLFFVSKCFPADGKNKTPSSDIHGIQRANNNAKHSHCCVC
jgi:hypothetical protein